MRLVFPLLSPALRLQGVAGSISGRSAEPAGENDLRAERTRLAGQDDEYRLRDLLCQMDITDLP